MEDPLPDPEQAGLVATRLVASPKDDETLGKLERSNRRLVTLNGSLVRESFPKSP